MKKFIFTTQQSWLVSYSKNILSVLIGSFILLNTSLLYANPAFWSEANFLKRSKAINTFNFMPDQYSLYQLNETGMRNYLGKSARSSNSSKTLSIPLPSREMLNLTITKTSVMAPQLAAKYPQIQTYQASVTSRPEIHGVVDINELGFHGMLFMEDGRRLFIDPRQSAGKTYYISYYDDEYHPSDKKKYQCSIDSLPITQHSAKRDANHFSSKKPLARTGANLRTYRLAMAATGTYTTHYGGTVSGALSAMTTTIARVNQIYERDLAVKLELIADNDKIIFTDATDPYTDNTDNSKLIDENTAVINPIINVNNYDIGHVVTKNEGGGIAALGSVCSSFKAEAMTGHPDPKNDPFDIDFLAHELGHQFGANHSFNAIDGGCNRNPLDNSTPSTAWEIGNGATIMSYAGVCESANDVVSNSIAMFHTGSIREMSQFIDDSSQGSSCGTASSLSNQQPTANAGSDYTIPAETPFQLVGIGNDADSGDILSYSWEQMDLGNSANIADGDVTGTDNPLFRVFAPSNSNTRTFPQLPHILANTQSIGEILPTTDRNLKFALTVRDQKGGVADDEVNLAVIKTSTPFKITSHTTSSSFVAGTSTSITWDVGETDITPISCSNVDLSISVDGGHTFPTFLIQNSANDGNETVVIPSNTTANTETRFKVACSNNIFFDISDANLNITASVTPSAVELIGTITPPSDVVFVEEDACLSGGSTPIDTCRRVSLLLMQGSTVLGQTTVKPNNTYILPFSGTLPLDAYLQVITKFTDSLAEEVYYYNFGADNAVGGATSETADVFVPIAGVTFDTNGIPSNVNPLMITATPTTVNLDVSALPPSTTTTTNVELTGQVTLPTGMALIPDNACLDTGQTPAVPLGTCRRVTITLMEANTVLGTTSVNVGGSYTLPFTEPLPVDAHLKISTKFTDALAEEEYYYDFGTDKLVGGTDVFIPLAGVTFDANGIPSNVNPLMITATPTTVNLDVSALPPSTTTTTNVELTGQVTLPTGMVLIPDNACLDTGQTPAVPLGTCRRVTITLMEANTVLGTTSVNVGGSYTLPFTLPATQPLPIDAHLKISTKFTDALTEEEYYYDFGTDKLVGGDRCLYPLSRRNL